MNVPRQLKNSPGQLAIPGLGVKDVPVQEPGEIVAKNEPAQYVYLGVPYSEHDEAKNIGALWDDKFHMWYVQSSQYDSRFEKWSQWFIEKDDIDQFAKQFCSAVIGTICNSCELTGSKFDYKGAQANLFFRINGLLDGRMKLATKGFLNDNHELSISLLFFNYDLCTVKINCGLRNSVETKNPLHIRYGGLDVSKEDMVRLCDTLKSVLLNPLACKDSNK